METKFIIVKDKRGKLRHFKSDWLHHYTIARDNGFEIKDIIEEGIILDGQLFIFECIDKKHLKKSNKFIFSNKYQDLRLCSYYKGRQLESMLMYGILKEGD